MAYVQSGWLDIDQAPSSQDLNGTQDEWWLMMSDSQNNHIGREGTLKAAKIKLTDHTQLHAIAFAVLRLVSGTNYTLIGKSQDIDPDANGIVEHEFTTPIENVRIDDILALIARPNSATAFMAGMDTSETIPIDDSATAEYRWHDSGDTTGTNPYVVGTNYDCTGGGTIFRIPMIVPMMDAPDVVVVGDSISQGSPLNNCYKIDDTDKDPDGAYANIAYRQLGWDWELAGNTDAGLANTFDDVLNDDIGADLWAKAPSYLHVHCGVNDINESRSWADVEDDLDDIRTACIANDAKLILSSIFPWTGNAGNTTGDHDQNTTRDSWNINLRKWAASRDDVFFVDINDMISQERLTAKSGDGTPPSGNSWDIYDAFEYTTDSLGVHLNATGAAAAGAAFAVALQKSLGQVNITHINGSRDAARSQEIASALRGNKATQTKSTGAIVVRNVDDDGDLYTVTLTDNGTTIVRSIA